VSRSFTITEEHIRAYSRRGNYHSDADTAAELGLPGLVAQGTQAFGPAYALAIDALGDELIEHGILDLKFVGIVTAGDTVEAHVAPADGALGVEVRNMTTDRIAVVGTVSLAPDPRP
jgi:acyl dehydratase